jgi:hypothetical protein
MIACVVSGDVFDGDLLLALTSVAGTSVSGATNQVVSDFAGAAAFSMSSSALTGTLKSLPILIVGISPLFAAS